MGGFDLDASCVEPSMNAVYYVVGFTCINATLTQAEDGALQVTWWFLLQELKCKRKERWKEGRGGGKDAQHSEVGRMKK